MVLRTIEVKKMAYKVEKYRIDQVISRLEDLYGQELEIGINGEKIIVSGDLHNYKRRERIMWILSGGKHGSDLQAS